MLTVALFAVACGDAAGGEPSDLFFPHHTISGPGMLARLEGRLTVQDQCVFIVTREGDRVLPIWPPGFRLAATARGIEVVDGSGKVLALQDDFVKSGGGETVTERYAYELMGGAPPSA